ncbi:hypothetical protein ACFXPR_36065 [Nocardia tengchongensis]|uniref:hypothetical protein n=1 Tax=Nocardia tengchongensis TaxID=2055889 RepID=UPI003686D2E3
MTTMRWHVRFTTAELPFPRNPTTGKPPITLALAKHLDLPNTTFRRNFPDIATGLQRRRVQSEQEVPSAASKFELLAQENQALKTTHQDLTEHLELAAANIQRLTIENHQLRRALEAAGAVTRIGATALLHRFTDRKEFAVERHQSRSRRDGSEQSLRTFRPVPEAQT